MLQLGSLHKLPPKWQPKPDETAASHPFYYALSFRIAGVPAVEYTLATTLPSVLAEREFDCRNIDKAFACVSRRLPQPARAAHNCRVSSSQPLQQSSASCRPLAFAGVAGRRPRGGGHQVQCPPGPRRAHRRTHAG